MIHGDEFGLIVGQFVYGAYAESLDVFAYSFIVRRKERVVATRREYARER